MNPHMQSYACMYMNMCMLMEGFGYTYAYISKNINVHSCMCIQCESDILFCSIYCSDYGGNVSVSISLVYNYAVTLVEGVADCTVLYDVLESINFYIQLNLFEQPILVLSIEVQILFNGTIASGMSDSTQCLCCFGYHACARMVF